MGAFEEVKNRYNLANNQNRRDIVLQKNPEIARAIQQQQAKTLRADVLPFETSRESERLLIRRSLIESDKSDPNGFERVIGLSDLLSVNFLRRGLLAAAAVCRIRVPTQGGEWYGTAFLVGPRLLMTNNHVLSTPEDASQSEAEFNYEHDADGVLSPAVQFNLAPHEIFYTDVELDVTFVAVAPFSEGGIPLERYGYLPLIPLSGKAIHGEWVTIIQHPGGQPKQMTVRANQVIELNKEDFPEVPAHLIHYTTDTEPGSSGSPVLNDQWQVIAIHHKAIPKPSAGQIDAEPRPDQWLANEGIRVSAIYRLLESARFADRNAAAILDRLSRALGIEPLNLIEVKSISAVPAELEAGALPQEHWTAPQFRLGYDPRFLPVELKLETILGQRRRDAARLLNGDAVTLDYLHFSTVIDRERKFPMLTAVNIHGAKLRRPTNSSSSWRRDSRLEEILQPGDNFYTRSLGDDPVSFDRGHLVRRLDPCWGDSQEEVNLAEQHTFHFTNAAPQVHKYNDIVWGDLEDYVLDRAQTKEKKVTVFSGPLFKPQDPEYGRNREHGPWNIPVTFWKIAVIEKPGGKIAAAAFMIGQIEFLAALFEARVFTGLKPYTLDELKTRRIQTTIQTVEQESGFDFSVLRPFDAQNALESTRQTRILRSNSEINI
jgi:endonuclease G